jgi:predicted kinase
MPTPPSARSVRISDDERGGWSSDRPRRDGKTRPANISTRCHVLRPADRLRYSPGSLLVVVSASPDEREAFVERLVSDRASILSLPKVRGLLAGRVSEEEMEERAAELLRAALQKRLAASETVVLVAEGVEPADREPYIRMAAEAGRPRHVILIETGRDQVADEDRAALNELRRALDAGELGAEGVQTALRLGGGTAGEVKRLVFQPPPREE